MQWAHVTRLHSLVEIVQRGSIGKKVGRLIGKGPEGFDLNDALKEVANKYWNVRFL